MMIDKIAIPVSEKEIVPRFDLATEVLILIVEDQSLIQDKKVIVLSRSSADELCHLLLAENVTTLICGAIEEEYYQFLEWKEIDIFDAVSGTWFQAFEQWQLGKLASGDILTPRIIEGQPLEEPEN